MKSTYSLDEALNSLSGLRGLVFILQDWDSGMQVYNNCSGEEVAERLTEARVQYGDRFGFRAFNEDTDVYWNGDFGIICAGIEAGKTQQILLEFDTKRHPGMASFEINKNLRSLRIVAREISSTDGETFLRFIKLLEVKSDDSAGSRWTG